MGFKKIDVDLYYFLGRGLVRELVSQDTTARGYKTGLETQKPLER